MEEKMEKKKFTQEFKQDTIDYYHSSGKSIREVSEEIGIGSSTLSRWLSDARKNDGKIEHRGSGNSIVVNVLEDIVCRVYTDEINNRS